MLSTFSRRNMYVLLILGVIFTGAAIISASDGYTAWQATPVQVIGPNSICRKITNSSGTGLSLYSSHREHCRMAELL